ncbi:MAG: hypothetical protein A2138_26720 [Deltaproteobacteria bacterium RBG_16_71_12]|nr:MAG: hypothetical protein A2138_26720 [Deltaproteobacteria bacterium RBG_16_71_12]
MAASTEGGSFLGATRTGTDARALSLPSLASSASVSSPWTLAFGVKVSEWPSAETTAAPSRLGDTTLKVTASPSGSTATSGTVTGWSSAVSIARGSMRGASGAGTSSTVTVTSAAASPSLTSTTKVSLPLTSRAGAKRNAPVASSSVTVPCAGPFLMRQVRGSLSMSVAVTLPESSRSSLPDAATSLGTGASLTASSVRVTSAAALSLPSVTSKRNPSAPFSLASGV